MTTYTVPERTALRNETLDALSRLRAAFPLEQRIEQATAETRRSYGQVLTHWLRGEAPPVTYLPPAELRLLSELDAVVLDSSGIGCYPFSARDSGIQVQFGPHSVYAMCAIDALAIARIARCASRVEALCITCFSPIVCEVEADGSLSHDKTETARIAWRHAVHNTGSCSDGLCRELVFLCNRCQAPINANCLTLCQATAVANAFFSFQRRLIVPAPA